MGGLGGADDDVLDVRHDIDAHPLLVAEVHDLVAQVEVDVRDHHRVAAGSPA